MCGVSVRYADIVVEPASEPDESLATIAPEIIVEVLSPSTTSTDLEVKRDEYLKIAKLQAYIVASQDEPAMMIWERQADGAFPSEPREVEGATAKLSLHACGQTLELDFAQIYADLS
jgi:Uma2 family endonuclease